MNKEKVLITFVGKHDSLAFKNYGSENRKDCGPIVDILARSDFDKIILVSNSETGDYDRLFTKYVKFLDENFKPLKVEQRYIDAENPIDYNIVYPAMAKLLIQIKSQFPDSKFTISLTSGTPVMHTCWVLLVAGGIIDAELLQSSRERGIETVNFSLDDFPKITLPSDAHLKLTQLNRKIKYLQKSSTKPIVTSEGITIPDSGFDLENEFLRDLYIATLEKTDHNASAAAKLLRLKPHTFRKRLRALKIELKES